MIEIKITKKSSKNGSIKKNSKIQIKKLVRTNTIHAFDAVCGHTKSFYTDSDGIILKKNSRAGIVFYQFYKAELPLRVFIENQHFLMYIQKMYIKMVIFDQKALEMANIR